MRPDWNQLAERCQKPDYRRVGNWYARRVSRPLALRVTWLILPTGISAHAVTLLAWIMAIISVALLTGASTLSFLAAVASLQLWYLLDHVDGQVARFRGTASLDGVHLDYTMHHTINLLVPLAMGYRSFELHRNAAWLLAGVAWGLGSLLLGIDHDTRCKAFVQRLKRLHGELRVIGGGGGRPEPACAAPHSLARRIPWLARKACEPHVVMNCLTAIAVVEALLALRLLSVAYLAVMAVVALFLAMLQIGRNLAREAAEQEFAAWFRVPEGHELLYEDGWWTVVPAQAAENRHLLDRASVSSTTGRA